MMQLREEWVRRYLNWLSQFSLKVFIYNLCGRYYFCVNYFTPFSYTT